MRRLKFLLTGVPYYPLKSGMVERPYFRLRIQILLQQEAHWLYRRLFDERGGRK